MEPFQLFLFLIDYADGYRPKWNTYGEGDENGQFAQHFGVFISNSFQNMSGYQFRPSL